MKIYLVTPKNPPSFWTYDEILPALDKQCIFPNLSMPTIAGLTPREHEVVLCDENVEEIDFATDADIVGVTGYIIHRERMLEISDEFRRRGRFVASAGPSRRSVPRICAATATCSSSTRPRRPGASSCATSRPACGRRSTGRSRSRT